MDAQDKDLHEIPLDTHPLAKKPVKNEGMLSVRQVRPQSYEQRRHIERNREHIDAYHTAGVIHGYKHLAKDARSSAVQTVRAAAPGGGAVAHQRLSPVAQAVGARQQNSGAMSSSPFSPRRHMPGAGNASHGHVAGGTKMPSRTFTEPTTRRYNPYA